MSDEDRMAGGYAQGASGPRPWTAGQPAGEGGLAEREIRPPEAAAAGRTIILQPTAAGGPAGPGRPGGPGGAPGPDPKRSKTVPRPFFYAVLSLLTVALLAIAGLVLTRPAAGTAVALRTPGPARTSPAASQPASPSPGSSSSSSPGGAASTSPAASTSASASSAATAAPDPSGANLFNLTPVQNNAAYSFIDASEQIGTTTYPDSVRFTCASGSGYNTSLIYDVAGYRFLNATVGVPSNATNAAGNTMAITFFRDGSTQQLGKSVTIALDQPVQLHLNLAGASQLEIACASTSTSTQHPADMDVAFGNAVLTSP